MRFKTAINKLKEGKKVRRPSWKKDSYWTLGVDQTIVWNDEKFAHIHIKQIEADDWEIYRDEEDRDNLERFISRINNIFEGFDGNWITKKTVGEIAREELNLTKCKEDKTKW